MMGPGGGGHGLRRLGETSEEKAKNRGKVLGRLIRLLKPYYKMLFIAFLLILVSAATQGIGPYLIGLAVDRFIGGADPNGLAMTMLILAIVYLVGMFATRYQIFLVGKAGQNLLANLRQRVFNQILNLSMHFLEGNQAGELMSRLVNDIDALNNFFSQALNQMIGAVFSLIGIMVAMFVLSWQLALSVLIMLPALVITTTIFSRRARKSFRKTRETIGDVSAGLEEELGGVKVAQAFNRTDKNVSKFEVRNAANRDANINAIAITSAFTPTMDIISTLDLALVAALGGYLVINHTFNVGVVVAFLQYTQNFFRPIQMVSQMWTVAQSSLAAAERVFDLLDMVPTVQDVPDAITSTVLEGKVVFNNVSFGYEDNEPVLDEVSFKAEPGETVAIVGPTGAGKTTIASLIARFYDVEGGLISIDGYDVRNFAQRNLRSHMGIVTQEPFLFSGTVMENIRYGRLNASDDEVIATAQAANADDFISRLQGGYNTEVGERGKLLSQGQRQLIAIARAILANPRILILDEATASVDTRTEVMIQKAMKQLLKGRTSFVIAHRLSTIRNADQVLVIDHGKIVEYGTHQDLLVKGGLYTELYNKQFYNPLSQSLKPAINNG